MSRGYLTRDQMIEQIRSLRQKVIELEEARSVRIRPDNEKTFFRIFYHSPTAMALTYLEDGRLIDVNEEFLRLTEYSREELTGRSTVDLNLYAVSEQRNELVKKLKTQGKVRNFSLSLNSKTGQKKDLLWSGETIQIGNDSCVISSTTDITDHKKTEDALREYQMAVETSHDMIAVLDRNYEYKIVNKAFLRQRALSRSQVINCHAKQILGEKIFADVIKPKMDICFQGMTVNYEIKYDYPDIGTRYLDVKYYPLKNEAGTVERIVAIIADITESRNAEIELRRSEQQHRLITDNIQDTVWLMDMNLRTTWISPSVIKTRGFTQEELFRIPLHKQLTPESYETAQKLIADNLSNIDLANKGKEIAIKCELEFYRKDGSTFWSEINVSLLRDEEGKPAGFLGVGRDITVRRYMETELREAQRELEEAYHLAHIGNWRWSMLDDLVVWSEEICRMVGIDGKKFSFLRTKHPRVYSEESWQKLNNIVDLILKTGQSQSVELEIRRPNGRPGWINWVGTASYDKEGRITGIHGTAQDITERKLAESKLKAYADKISNLYNNAPCGYHSVGTDGTFLSINDTELKLLGYKWEEIIGKKKCRDLLTPASKKILKNKLPSFMAQGSVNSLELEAVRKDGSILPIILNASAILDEEGHLIESQATIFDITELKKTHEELVRTVQQLNDAKDMLIQSEKLAAVGTLSAGVAHEILNPINVISMRLQLLELMEGLPAEVYEAQRICQEQVERVVRITKDLSLFARIESKNMKNEDLNKVVLKSFDLIRHRARMEKVELQMHLAEALPEVCIDRNKFEQVIFNIANNALDAMGDQEEKILRITTTTGMTEDKIPMVRFIVSDNGRGIKEEDLGKIFDPFFTTKPAGKGTGLGLSISYGIIKDHQGRIWVENNERGGATFVVELPERQDRQTVMENK